MPLSITASQVIGSSMCSVQQCLELWQELIHLGSTYAKEKLHKEHIIKPSHLRVSHRQQE